MIPDPKALPVKLLVPWYLMASYLYYECSISIMSDSEYDQLCKKLDELWAFAKKHRHSHLVDRASLSATTGYYLNDLPQIVKNAAVQLARELGRA